MEMKTESTIIGYRVYGLEEMEKNMGTNLMALCRG